MMQSGKISLKLHKLFVLDFCIAVLGIFNATFNKKPP